MFGLFLIHTAAEAKSSACGRGSKAAQVTPEEGMQRRSAAFNQSIIMTDLSVVPQGTVSKTKAKIENLKRTHSFENPLRILQSKHALNI